MRRWKNLCKPELSSINYLSTGSYSQEWVCCIPMEVIQSAICSKNFNRCLTSYAVREKWCFSLVKSAFHATSLKNIGNVSTPSYQFLNFSQWRSHSHTLDGRAVQLKVDRDTSTTFVLKRFSACLNGFQACFRASTKEFSLTSLETLSDASGNGWGTACAHHCTQRMGFTRLCKSTGAIAKSWICKGKRSMETRLFFRLTANGHYR